MSTEYTIERLGHRGDGIAAGPVYVPASLPGEVVSGDLAGDRLTNVKILTPSVARVRAPCRHFKSCGGCALQHASDDFLRDWKVQVVAEALNAHGLSGEVAMLATSPANSRRRATLAGRRTKKGAIVGLHGRASGTLVEIPGCTLLHADLLAARPCLEALTLAGASRKGEISLAVTQSDAGVDVAVSGGKPLTSALEVTLAGLASHFDLARLTWDDEVIATRRKPAQGFGQAQVVPPPGAFLQATQQGQAALVAAVTQGVGLAGSVLELFAGCGTFSLPLAQQATVHAVEGEAQMLAALDHGWRHGVGLKQVTTEVRDLFRRPFLASEINTYDAVVLDPPRAGAAAQVGELAKADVATIVYVSCNPVTFARDARLLVEAGFAIATIGVVDQFRWSPHVELVTVLSRR